MADRRRPPAARRRVVLRPVRHQRARRPRAGARGQSTRTVEQTARPAARRHRGCSRCPPPRPTNCAAPRAGSPTGSSRPEVRHPRPRRPGLHAGPPPGAPTGAHRRHGRTTAPSSLAGTARGRRRRRRPIEPAVAEGDRGPVWVFSGQGSQWAAMGAGLLATEPVFAADRRRDRTADRRGVRLLGHRGDVGSGDGHRHRPGAADRLRRPGRARRHAEVLRRGARARSSATRWARSPPPSSPARCRWRTASRSSAAARA